MCLDAEKICGKKLSMPTDAFTAEFRRDLLELNANGSLSNCIDQWNETIVAIKTQFKIQQ